MRRPDKQTEGEIALVPDCGGLIDQVALTLPTGFLRSSHSDEWFQPLIPIGNLLKSFPAETLVFLLVDQGALALAAAWVEALAATCRIQFVPMTDGGAAVESPWLQDVFHIRSGFGQGAVSGEILTLDGRPEGRALASFLGIATRPAMTGLHGGNQLVGDDFRLVGHNDVAGASGAAASLALEAMDSRPVTSFGYQVSDLMRAAPDGVAAELEARVHQFGFHVDQFVSVTGLLRDARPLLMVAEPHLPEGPPVPMVEDARRRLDASVSRLRRQGFEVLRNPVPWVVAPDSGKRLPRLYNNVIIENQSRAAGRKPLVWLPQFSDVEPLHTFDSRNREMWQGLGFEIVPVYGWSYFSSRNGAIRCVSKILRRS